MKVVLRDTLTTYWRGKMQYDRGQYLEIYNSGVYENNVIFQFIQNGEQRDILGELVNHEYYKVRIPDEFLKNEDEIKCFLYVESEEAAETKKIIIIDVMDREWYDSEPSEEEISLMGQLIDKINLLQESLENFVLSDEQREAIVSQVIEEAKKELNFDDYYTKSIIDENYYSKSEIDKNHYTKTEIQTNYYSKSIVNGMFSNLSAQVDSNSSNINKINYELGLVNTILEDI